MHVFLTEEVVNQLSNGQNTNIELEEFAIKINSGEIISHYRTPERNDNDLVFAMYQDREHANPKILYFDLAKSFGKTLDRIGKGLREESNNNRRRKITPLIQTICEDDYI